MDTGLAMLCRNKGITDPISLCLRRLPGMSERGFVLAELLVAIGAALLVLGIMFGTFTYFEKQSYDREAEVAQMKENLRAGMLKMGRELPMAGTDPTRASGAGLVVADADTIRFTMDLNGDGDVLDGGEDVTYALDTHQRQLTRNGQPVAVHIPHDGLEFKYFDRHGHELVGTPLDDAMRERVSRINIRLTARTADPDPEYPRDKGYRSETVASDVSMHNLILASARNASTTEPLTAVGSKTAEKTPEPSKTTEGQAEREQPKPPTTTKVTKAKPATKPPATLGMTQQRARMTIATKKPSATVQALKPQAAPEETPDAETTTAEQPDTEGPSISDTSRVPFGSHVPNGVTVSICAAVTDPSGVESVTLLSDQHGSVTMSADSGDTYCANLSEMKDTVVTYYVITHDTLGHESTRGPYSYSQGK